MVRGGRIQEECLGEKWIDSLLCEPPTRSWSSSTVTEGMPYTLIVSRGGCWEGLRCGWDPFCVEPFG